MGTKSVHGPTILPSPGGVNRRLILLGDELPARWQHAEGLPLPVWPVLQESSMRSGSSIAFSSPEEYVPLAQAAEERGFAWVTLADHLIYPKQFSVPYPYTPDGVPRFADSDPFPDPWIAVTDRK